MSTSAETSHSGERRPLPSSLKGSLGERFVDHFQRGDAVLGQHGSCVSHFAPVLPDAVVFAHSTDDVVALVKLCSAADIPIRSEEHTSELQSLMRTSYAVLCLKKNNPLLNVT